MNMVINTQNQITHRKTIKIVQNAPSTGYE